MRMRIKEICDFVSRGKTPDYVDQSPYKVMNQATFSKGRLDETNVRYTSHGIEEARIRRGDLLMASTGGGVLGKVYYFDSDDDAFYADSHVSILRNGKGKHLMKYLYYVFSIRYEEINATMVKGSTNQTELQKNYLLSYEMDMPSLSEQQRIVAYLDEKTAEIDRQVALLEKELDACLRLKCAVINRSVTQGLNPNVPLKDSGIDWIGMIPEHWKVKRIKDAFELRNGYTPSKNNPAFWESGTIPWYRMDDIRESGRKLKEAKQYITPEAVKGNGLFEAGSFILATTATIGEHAMLIVDSLANQRFTNLKIRKSLITRLSKEFLFYYMFIVDDFCKTSTRQTTFAAVNIEELKNFIVVIPTIEEQQSIATYLDAACAKIDAKAENIRKRIDAYKRLKRSLINEVITGKRAV